MALRELSIVEAVWERLDAEYAHTQRLELAGERPEGSAFRWYESIRDVALSLPETAELHPRLSEGEDRSHVGYRAAQVAGWRLIYRATEETVTVLELRHARERPREVIDRS